MAHVQKRGPGRWRARYRGPDGRERSRTFRRKADAERFLATVETDKVRGTWVDPRLSRTSIEAFWHRQLLPHLISRIRPTTLDLYTMLWRRYLLSALGERPLGTITRLDIEEFVARLTAAGVGAPTVGAALRLLHRILEAAHSAGIIARNPASGVKAPSLPQQEMPFFTAAEVERLIVATPDFWRAFVLLAAWGGLRFGEIAALRIDRIDFLRRHVRIEETLTEVNGTLRLGPTKTRAKRVVTLPAFVIEAVAEHIRKWPPKDDGFLFRSRDGGLPRRSNFRRRVWHLALEAAGLPQIRFHDLRHTAAALAIAAGAHPKALQARLGHSSITTTLDRYGHLMEGLDTELATRLELLQRHNKDTETTRDRQSDAL